VSSTLLLAATPNAILVAVPDDPPAVISMFVDMVTVEPVRPTATLPLPAVLPAHTIPCVLFAVLPENRASFQPSPAPPPAGTFMMIELFE
jgi:hypothetical protein